MAKIGDKIIGNWGAYFANSTGIIVGIEDGCAEIKWNDGEAGNSFEEISKIKPEYKSAIGLYFAEK